MKNTLLYVVTVSIWGTTWFAIKFQLGVVSPLVSIFYRFVLAGLVLLLFCLLFNHSLRFSKKQHLWIGLQGVLLFCLPYIGSYLAIQYLTSGLVAVVFSSVVFMNIVNAAILLRKPVQKRVMMGAVLGFVGISFVFLEELTLFRHKSQEVLGLAIALGGTLFYSWGQITSQKTQRDGIPVLQANAFGMVYSSLVMLFVALLLGSSIRFDPSPTYIGSLLYLIFFASIAVFGCYLTLIGRIGAPRASYAFVLFPIVALFVSTMFENYQWKSTALIGVTLILVGNLLVLLKQSPS